MYPSNSCEKENMSDNIENLVTLAINGDQDAFSELVILFQKPVFYTVYRVVRDRGMADDITQEIFLRVYKKMKDLKKPSSFKSWLLRAAMNRAIDCKRKMSREGEKVFLIDDFSILGQGACDPSSGGISQNSVEEKERLEELQSELHNAIESLPDNQKKVLLLSMNDGMSQGEIGKILGIPGGTVKSRLHHARKHLAIRLKHLLKGD